MRICFFGFDNLPVLAPEYRNHTIGGESVQQSLLARALAERGHDVSMVTFDYGQRDGARWSGVRVFKAYAPIAGVPVLRFGYPRWTGIWAALARADAEIYYTSCAGMHVALASMFCARHGRALVFRAASDSDCDPSRLLIQYSRDRWLYAYGLRRADAILVQSAFQKRAMASNFGLPSRIAGMMVERAAAAPGRDIDVLWVGNIRGLKRPDRLLRLAAQLPDVAYHMVGGALPGELALYERTVLDAAARPDVTFHGPLPYHDALALYPRARVLVSTSEIEGLPNCYLQAWAHGVPVISFQDPDSIIRSNGLGVAVRSEAEMLDAVRGLLGDPVALAAASARCQAFAAREYGDEAVVGSYLSVFAAVLARRDATARTSGSAGTGAAAHASRSASTDA